jgi:hypothetical protein
MKERDGHTLIPHQTRWLHEETYHHSLNDEMTPLHHDAKHATPSTKRPITFLRLTLSVDASRPRHFDDDDGCMQCCHHQSLMKGKGMSFVYWPRHDLIVVCMSLVFYEEGGEMGMTQ